MLGFARNIFAAWRVTWHHHVTLVESDWRLPYPIQLRHPKICCNDFALQATLWINAKSLRRSAWQFKRAYSTLKYRPRPRNTVKTHKNNRQYLWEKAIKIDSAMVRLGGRWLFQTLMTGFPLGCHKRLVRKGATTSSVPQFGFLCQLIRVRITNYRHARWPV
jgi:hypothetical protein